MSAHSEEAYREVAKWKNDLSVDDDAIVSLGDDSGAYVQVWVWVSDDEAAEVTL